METLKEERRLVVVKRLRNRNIFIMERSQEDGPAVKRCRMENLDGQQIIQEKQRTKDQPRIAIKSWLWTVV